MLWLHRSHGSPARLREPSDTGPNDAAITRRFTAEGLRGMRRTALSHEMGGEQRRDHGLRSAWVESQRQDRIDGRWTTDDLSRQLGVLPLTRHPPTGHLLMANDPVLLTCLRAVLATEGTRDWPTMGSSGRVGSLLAV